MRTRVIGSENMDLILDDDNTRRQVWQVAYKGKYMVKIACGLDIPIPSP